MATHGPQTLPISRTEWSTNGGKATGSTAGYPGGSDFGGETVERIELLIGDETRAVCDPEAHKFTHYDDLTLTFYGTTGRAYHIGLDIKPLFSENIVNPNSRLNVWVAALSDDRFDALQTDLLSVRFGPDEARVTSQRVADINSDGLADLLMRFRIPETGIDCGDTEATLTGETFGGKSLTGTDSIRTVRCP